MKIRSVDSVICGLQISVGRYRTIILLGSLGYVAESSRNRVTGGSSGPSHTESRPSRVLGRLSGTPEGLVTDSSFLPESHNGVMTGKEEDLRRPEKERGSFRRDDLRRDVEQGM